MAKQLVSFLKNTNRNFNNILDSYLPLQTENGADTALTQFDGIEVARIKDGANLPSAAGTSTSVASGNSAQGGFGYRKMVYVIGSGNDDNVVTLTANQSGGIFHITPTNVLGFVLPVGIPGIHYKFLIADKINKALTFKTAGAGSDNNDTFQMRCQTLADDGATMDVDGDTLTFTNALEGSWIDLVCITGGANELWHAAVFGTDTVAATVADS